MSRKIKVIRRKPLIKYSGSLIQQNHSEALHHGLLVWDIAKRKTDFIVIDNENCYYTLEINKGEYSSLPDALKTKNIRLRVKVQDTEASVLESIIADIKTEFNIEEITIRKINDFSGHTRVNKINIGDVRDVEYQNELITKYLKNKFVLDDVILDGIRHVNRTVNSSLPKLEVTRHISWIPKRFEFSNMFSYGPDNVIDFTNMHGTYGIFAQNAFGKSTLLDAITYCIYDKCSRASKAINILNNKSHSFTCKFNFELDGRDYFIEKTGTKTKGAHVRVDIDFYTVNELGQRESLNGKERSETNDAIRSILGTYENFVLTALSVQNNSAGFIDMAQRERKDLLAQFLDINIFEDLYNIASMDIKDTSSVIKDYQRQDFSSQLAAANSAIQKHKADHGNYCNNKKQIQSDIDQINQEILQLTSKLIPIDSTISDIQSLNSQKLKWQQSLQNNVNEKRNYEIDIAKIAMEINTTETEISNYDLSFLNSQIQRFNELQALERVLHTDVEKLKVDIHYKVEKMKKLEDLKYDENCVYCMDNIFVKDAIETKTAIEHDKTKAIDLVNKLKQVQDEIENLRVHVSSLSQYNALEKRLQLLKSKQSENNSYIQRCIANQTQINSKLTEIEYLINEYYKKEESITINAQIKSEISQYNEQLNAYKQELSTLERLILTAHSNLIIAEQNKKQAEASIKRLQDLERQYKYYQYYLEAVNRDGVPYDLITTSVPYIEQEINNILTQLVDFNLMLEMDGKNINCYIVYDDDNFWPIELTSGMEKFISSLAIRTALINISALPRPNFLAIDEGLGNLDASVLSDFINMLEYLETQFTFVILISHIDASRDMVKTVIEITKQNGFSKVSYE